MLEKYIIKNFLFNEIVIFLGHFKVKKVFKIEIFNYTCAFSSAVSKNLSSHKIHQSTLSGTYGIHFGASVISDQISCKYKLML